MSIIRKYDLTYYAYIENVNKHKIEKYNVLTDDIIEEILERTKDSTDKKSFAKQVEYIIMYHYWSKSEWEITLTSCPTRLRSEELARLNDEQEKHQKEFGYLPYSLTVNLTTEEKLDVYDQVMLNWDIFIDYVWKSLRRT